ncbi:MAG: DegT/DnrJ/EryC1/StrS family aminotransferase, partial [Acidimicrobiales bacterium]
QPALITIGSSLNLTQHPVAELRTIADEVGAKLLFDAAHLCGIIAGKQWANPIDLGAHMMTMSTYKSLGGPPGGLLVTNDAALAERIDGIAYPGLTANFDVGRTTALAFTLLDQIDFGEAYAAEMIATAATLSSELAALDLKLFETPAGFTTSHQFVVEAGEWGGGHPAALKLRAANILTSAIGLPSGDGLRIGTPEIVRWGLTTEHMAKLAELINRGLRNDPTSVAPELTAFRQQFDRLHFCT